MHNECVLITGADGYIGQLLISRLLKQSNCTIVMWVRADDDDEIQRKRTSLSSKYIHYLHRITLVFGHFQQHKPFQSIPKTQEISFIVHCAAVIRFNVEEQLANAVNRDATKKVLNYARQCKNLKRYIQLSTLYASGLQPGLIKEVLYEPQGPFANHYERSKCAAEHIIQAEYNDLPWQIVRLATVIADNEQGHVSQYNVFHNTMNLLYHGLISLLPGNADTPLYFVTGEFSATAIYSIMQAEFQQQRIFHVCHLEQESITLQQLLDCCFAVFSKQDFFQQRNILKPLLTDLETFNLLSEGLNGLSAHIVSTAVASMQPFAAQLFVHKCFDNSNLVSLTPAYKAPDINALSENIVQHLISTQWGKINND